VDYGLTAGLHSLNPGEIGTWLDTIQAGNLYVNRSITGAIVQRQPFGGWKKSAVGAGTKAGGPNYLIGLGSWSTRESTASAEPVPAAQPLLAAVAPDAGSELNGDDFAMLQRAAASDAVAWAGEFGTAKDVSALTAERNVFRYLPLPVTVRLSEGEPVVKLIRVLAAAAAAGSTVKVSSAVELTSALGTAVRTFAASVTVESDTEWLASVEQHEAGRIRLIGGEPAALAKATGGRPDLAVYYQPVTEAGRVELLPFLHEQAVSITAHRFGTKNELSEGLI
jgi:RHH-type proline utilization regulon transcriptional repressor/proline dehydrogenase/delta 1-pyrroline-5-carboxylate dehydrogenase